MAVAGNYVFVSAGETASGLVVGSGETLVVEAGGTALALTVSGGTVQDFGLTSGTTLLAGSEQVESGGAADATLISGGSFSVVSGGTESGTTRPAASAYVATGGQTLPGLTLQYGDTLTVEAGGTVQSLTVDYGASATVTAGGVASGVVLSGGTLVDSGTADGVTVAAGGLLLFDGTVSGVLIESGGDALDGVKAGVISGAVIQSGGELNIDNGSLAVSTTDSGGTLLIFDGRATSTLVEAGGVDLLLAGDSAEADFTTVGSGGREILGGAVPAGGPVVTLSTTVLSGGEQDVQEGATASATTVQGGKQIVDVGGTAVDTAVTSGGYAYSGSAYVVAAGQSSAGIHLIAGDGLVVSSGGTVTDLEVDSGASADILGTASGSVVNGGYMAVGVFQGTPGSAADTIVSSGGTFVDDGNAGSGTVVLSGGFLQENTTGSGVDVGSGGSLLVQVEGTEVDPALAAGAALQVVSGASLAFDNADSRTVSGFIGGSGSLTMSGAGTLVLADRNDYRGGTYLLSGTLELAAAGAAGIGPISFAPPVPTTSSADPDLVVDAADTPVDGGYFGNTIDSFGDGDFLDLEGFDYVAGQTSATLVGNRLDVTDGGETIHFNLTNPAAGGYFVQDDGSGHALVDDVAPVCFCAGTRILTARGEVAVEDLSIGDVAVTASGAHRPVRWIGRQKVDCRTHPRPGEVMPVRVSAGALGEGRPARDLWVSPGHALCLDLVGEVLVPASALVNGATVAQVDVERVTYWHVELDSHDILLAEGQPAESYMDTGNRLFFGTGEGVLDPERAHGSLADYCRPFHDAGPLVSAARHQLRARAHALGWRFGGGRLGGMHLVCDGERIEPEADGLVARFAVPAASRDVWLCSEAGAVRDGSDDPAADARRLGLCVGGLRIDDGLGAPRRVAHDDPRLIEGWHGAEGDHRWTDGHARLDPALWAGCRGVFFLRIALAAACLPGWAAPEGLVLSAAPGAAEDGATAARGLRLVHVA